MDNAQNALPKKRNLLKRFFLWLTVCMLPIFTALFFAPMEVFLGNIRAFAFSMHNVWWFLLLVNLAFSVAAALIILVIPPKFRWILLVCAFALGICFYLQALLMNGHMISMTGETVWYDRSLKIRNLAAWAAVFALILGLYYWLAVKKQRFAGETVLALVSAALLLMQTAGLVSLAVTNGADDKKGDATVVLSTEDEYTLSKGRNVIVFLLDTADVKYLEKALEEEPDLLEGLDGFTYYPDCISTYTRTYPSIVYLLTRQHCYFNIPYEEYVNSAYENSGFWKDLAAGCDDIRLFTDACYVGEAGWKDVANLRYTDARSLPSLNLKALVTAAANIGLYRSAPYAAKLFFLYSDAGVNKSVARNYNDIAYHWGDDPIFCDDVLRGAVSADSSYASAFRLYHLFGPHPGNHLDRNCHAVETPPPPEDSVIGSFIMLRSFFNQMKELGIYDSATIIISADHGISENGEHLQRESETRVMMLVKPANAENFPCRVSAAQVGHDDLFATVIDALGCDASQYGTAIYDIPEDLQRERQQFFTAYYSDIDGEVALREYRITGDASDFSNWSLTGRNWNIRCSERDISEHRLTDEYPDIVYSPVP